MSNFLLEETPVKQFKKKTPYDSSLKFFLSQMSIRDRLIARMIYFCDLNISQVLSLKKTDLADLKVPELLKEDIDNFSNHLLASDLVFRNGKGKEVNRVHLNQSFSRASKASNMRITPPMLLEYIPV